MNRKSIVFYGAGRYAETNLSRWIYKGLKPVCFADSDEKKHYSELCGFEVLPLDEAMRRFPDYELLISVKVGFFEVYEYLLENGVPRERFYKYSGPKWCPLIGRHFNINGAGVSACCLLNAVVSSRFHG